MEHKHTKSLAIFLPLASAVLLKQIPVKMFAEGFSYLVVAGIIDANE
jgi:hypothetical protein